MIEIIKKEILNILDDINICSTKNQISFLQISGDNRFGGFVSYLIFLDNFKEPVLYVKATRTKSQIFEELLKNEYLKIKHFRARVNDELVFKAIPNPVKFLSIDGLSILIVRAFNGSPLIVKNPKKILKLSIKWLTNFVSETVYRRSSLNEDIYIKYIKFTLDNLIKNINLNNEIKSMITKQFKNYIGSGEKIIISGLHGDFSAKNVLVRKNKITGVIDWEYSKFNYIPYSDFFHLLTRICFLQIKEDKTGKAKNFLNFFFNSKFRDTLENAISKYCTDLEISRELLEEYFLIYLAERSNLEHKFNSKYIQSKVIWDEIILEYIKNIEQYRFP